MKNSRFLIVVDDLRDWQPDWRNYPVVSADEYLTSDEYAGAGYRIVNLCRHDHKLSMGYYTSLLAEARGHRAMPTARTIQSLMSRRIYEAELEELNAAVKRSLSRIVQEDFSLSVYFGQNLAASHSRLSQTFFTIFPCPLFKVQFVFRDDGWEIGSLRPLGLAQVPKSHRFKVKEAMDAFLSKRWRTERDRPATGYDLAILHDPHEPHPPSNARALRNFVRAAEDLGLDVETITKSDFARLLEFDALFIRETTTLDNHTYRFATKAEREGMVVIDDPDSIRRCCNKVYMHELLRKNRVPVPRTEILSAKNLDHVADALGFPIVLKIPDSAFSMGVFKAEDAAAFHAKAAELLEDSDLVLAQEYLPTDFDWRVGILDRRPLYVCRYYMSRDHWQIYNHTRKGGDCEGSFETLPVEDAPPGVIATALEAASLIGDGFYGVDLKQKGGDFYVIEINDNPSIDAGIEDRVLGQKLYERIMRSFLDRIERSKQRAEESALAGSRR
jgi:glutathione synthase/RimK-type ligase-like ATP-grasp enzyme